MKIIPNDFIMTGAEPDEVWPLVRDHHYSGRMPKNIQHCYAVRRPGGLFGDSGEIVAGIIFSFPPTRWTEEVIELSRLVRLPDYGGQLSGLISFAMQWLRKSGHWNLAVSFANWTQKHHGGVYQGSGWVYGGMRERRMDGLIIDGQFMPGRSCNHAFGTQSPDRLRTILTSTEIDPHYDEGKHIYWKPLAISGRTKARRLGLQSLPYPKPNATGPLDERRPRRVSGARPPAVAPISAKDLSPDKAK